MPGKAFSGKQKKEQLQLKREKKREKANRDGACETSNVADASDSEEEERRVTPCASTTASHSEFVYGKDKAGIRSVFERESTAALEARKRLAYQPLRSRDFTPGVPFGSYFTMLGIDRDNLEERQHSKTVPYSVALPTRAHMVKEALFAGNSDGTREPGNGNDKNEVDKKEVGGNPIERAEQAVFEEWLRRVDALVVPRREGLQVNSFERNLDVWRQLWRTVELSDVVVVVADCRYPIVHLPVSLLHYIVVQCKKSVVVCMNKCDLIPPSVVSEWVTFLQAYFVACGVSKQAGDIPFVTFTSLPEAETAFGSEVQPTDKRRKAKQRTQRQYEDMKAGHRVASSSLEDELTKLSICGGKAVEGSSDCESATSDEDRYSGSVNFKGMQKAEQQLSHGKRSHKELAEVACMIDRLIQVCKSLHTSATLRGAGDSASGTKSTTIGFVGHPNVGKSSLLNCVRGTKVVSVSATAGHTKHLQTIPIPDEGITLVDCPGLAFPVLGLPRPLQAVIGTHQVAQTRDPQSGVAYLAARLPLEKIYGLRRVDGDTDEPWSAYDLCESYGHKKGFRVKHGKGIIDIHRSSIAILQEAYVGRLVLYFQPPPCSWLASDDFVQNEKPILLLFPIELNY